MLDVNYKAALSATCMVLMLSTLHSAIAATWTVERDGSGDFTVIQLAVDIAASGDTIRIGPGRFDEKQYVTCPGWSDSVRVLVSQEELTIIGSGPETIIGQEAPWDLEQGDPKGIVASDWWGNSRIFLENLHFENMGDGIYTSHENPCDVTIGNCTFYGNRTSAWMHSAGGRAQITECDFNHVQRDGKHIGVWGHTEFVIQGCTFRLWDVHQYFQKHIGFNGVQNAIIEDCEFLEGATGVSLYICEQVLFKNCLFDGQRTICIIPYDLTNVTVDNCTFKNGTNAIVSEISSNQIVVQNSVIENVTDSSFFISYAGSITVHDCDLAKGDLGVVWVMDINNCSTPMNLDMTNNYWGTGDPDSIQAWIRDNNDSEDACYIVDYEPYLDESTPVEAKSISDLKSLFH